MGSVDRVRQALKERGVDIVVVELDQSTRTAVMAAAAIGCEVGAIVKSLVLQADQQPTLVLASGDRQVDLIKVGRLLSAKQVSMARGAVVKELTGYAIGGVPPLVTDDINRQVPTLMDEGLFRYETVYAAAGSPFAIFPINPEELQRITEARTADVAES